MNAVRRHGLVWPPNIHQVTLLISFLCLEILYGIAISVHLLKDPLFICLFSTHIVLGVAVFLAFMKTSLTDPQESTDTASHTSTLYCTICELASPANSRHCRVCNKCVRGFDHHCPWLNTCIGSRNYRPFFQLLVCSASFLTLQALCTLRILVYSRTSASSIHWPLSDCGKSCTLAVACAQILICLVGDYAIGMLLALHTVLRMQGMTTYEFILMQRELKQLRQLHTALKTDAYGKEHKLKTSCAWTSRVCKSEVCKIQPIGQDDANLEKNAQSPRSRGVPSLYPVLAWRISGLLERERERVRRRHIQAQQSEQRISSDPMPDVGSIGVVLMPYAEDMPEIEDVCSIHSASFCSTVSTIPGSTGFPKKDDIRENEETRQH